MKYTITENRLKNIIKESVSKLLREYDEEELDYDKREFIKAMQKSRGNYFKASSDDRFKTGDTVSVDTKSGTITGKISDFDVNYMTFEETCDIEYFDHNRGHMWTLMGVPLSKVKLVNESKIYKKSTLNEAFNSNQLKQWFKKHGGVKKTFAEEGFPENRVPQDGLGDVSDDMILYLQEFENLSDASSALRNLKHSDNRHKRSDWDMAAHFVIYRANDGCCLLVGLDRKQIKTRPTWGGDRLEKSGDRYWRNEHNPYYVDSYGNWQSDKQVYHYGKKAQSHGVYHNEITNGFQGLKNNNQRLKGKMSPEEFNEYIQGNIRRHKDYVRNHFPPYGFE